MFLSLNVFKIGIRYNAARHYSSALNKKLIVPDNILKSPFDDVEIASCNLPEYIWKNMERWADKTAIICGVTNRSYTYQELYKHSRNFGANLRNKFCISKGDTVQIILHNCPEYAILVLGILQAGAVLSTMNPSFTHYEMQHNIVHSDPKIIISSPTTIPLVKTALKFTNKKVPIINVNVYEKTTPERTISFQELLQDTNCEVLNEAQTHIDDVSILPFSSGTTALPKGVELSARNLVTNYMQQDISEIKQYNDTTGSYQESIMAVLPFCHIYGLSLIMLHKLSVGAKIVSMPKFQPDSFLNALKEHKVSLLYAAPPLVLFLSSYANVKKKYLDSVTKIVNGAAPVPKSDVEKMLMEAKPNTQFTQVYGSTEASLVTSTVPGLESSEREETVLSSGFALPNTELKVVDQNGWTVKASEVGELLIRGPQIMKGYRHNKEATDTCMTSDGWFKSGDLARITKGSTLQIVDRIKEIIKVKGYQVPPVELENVLKEHSSVFDAGVIGVPHPRLGEVPKAFVVLKKDHKANKEDIIEFVRSRVTEYKAVREIEFMTALPKSPSGKLLRRVLKEYVKPN